jgi:preprotein translocase subunit YajC
MTQSIERGDMVFLSEGREGIGAVRGMSAETLTIYVENGGEFDVPRDAVKAVHDKKVILDAHRLPPALIKAVTRAHDREDPNLVG